MGGWFVVDRLRSVRVSVRRGRLILGLRAMEYDVGVKYDCYRTMRFRCNCPDDLEVDARGFCSRCCGWSVDGLQRQLASLSLVRDRLLPDADDAYALSELVAVEESMRNALHELRLGVA